MTGRLSVPIYVSSNNCFCPFLENKSHPCEWLPRSVRRQEGIWMIWPRTRSRSPLVVLSVRIMGLPLQRVMVELPSPKVSTASFRSTTLSIHTRISFHEHFDTFQFLSYGKELANVKTRRKKSVAFSCWFSFFHHQVAQVLSWIDVSQTYHLICLGYSTVGLVCWTIIIVNELNLEGPKIRGFF